jgi:hypothetical protein
MLLYRVLRLVRETFPIVAFWVYVGLFVVACPFLFILPLVTLLLFGFCLASLPFTALTARGLAAAQALAARRSIVRGRCPACGAAGDHVTGRAYRCDHCAATFDLRGAVVEGGEGTEEPAERVAVAPA